jgi:hypothetical protein
MLQLIAELADEETIAILTEDTDFLIYQYPEHVKYLSVKKFDFDSLFDDKQTLQTICYDRGVLAEYLNAAAVNFGSRKFKRRFDIGHLPLFATLKGNDLVDSQTLTGFHQRLSGVFYSLFYRLNV